MREGTFNLLVLRIWYIQNITVVEHDSHSDGAVRVEDRRFKDWDHYKITLWQTQLNFAVFVQVLIVVYLLNV